MAKQVEVQSIKQGTVQVKLRGLSPLIVHKFSVKAQGEMLAKQMKLAWPKKTPKKPLDQYDAATYYIDEQGNDIDCPELLTTLAEGKVTDFIEAYDDYLKRLRAIKKPRFGFPAVGLKSMAIRGAKTMGLVMTDMRGAFHISREYVEIHGERAMRCDMVRIGMGVSDIRFRPEFKDWRTEFLVRYNENVITPDLIYNMFNTGGFCCGIGEWRPARGGAFGMCGVEGMKNEQ